MDKDKKSWVKKVGAKKKEYIGYTSPKEREREAVGCPPIREAWVEEEQMAKENIPIAKKNIPFDKEFTPIRWFDDSCSDLSDSESIGYTSPRKKERSAAGCPPIKKAWMEEDQIARKPFILRRSWAEEERKDRRFTIRRAPPGVHPNSCNSSDSDLEKKEESINSDSWSR